MKLKIFPKLQMFSLVFRDVASEVCSVCAVNEGKCVEYEKQYFCLFNGIIKMFICNKNESF